MSDTVRDSAIFLLLPFAKLYMSVESAVQLLKRSSCNFHHLISVKRWRNCICKKKKKRKKKKSSFQYVKFYVKFISIFKFYVKVELGIKQNDILALS